MRQPRILPPPLDFSTWFSVGGVARNLQLSGPKLPSRIQQRENTFHRNHKATEVGAPDTSELSRSVCENSWGSIWSRLWVMMRADRVLDCARYSVTASPQYDLKFEEFFPRME